MISLFAGDQLEQSNPVVGLAMPWRVVGLMALWFLTPPYFLSAGEELQAEKIYAWEFQSSEDRNNDQWPDGWRRRAGRNFPAYIPIRIAPRDPEMARAAREAQPILNRWWLAYQTGNYFKQFIPESSPEPIAQFVDRFLINNCLSIDMDGGAVELESAPFPLDSRFTYNLDAALMAEGLNGHSAWVELLLLNQSLEVVGRAATKSVTGSVPWTWVNANSLNSQVFTHGQIALHVAPGESGQLSGNLKIDEIRLYCMPKLELEVHAPHHVVISGEPIDITCTVLGVQDARSMVNFQLSDLGGKVLERAQVTLTPLASEPAVVETAEASETPRGIMVNKVARTQANAAASPAPLPTISRSHKSDGSAKWSTRISDPGYYRITVNLGRESAHAGGRQISRQASVVVIDDRPAGVGGPFGWSLPDFTHQFTPENVPELIKLAGVGWMKIPIWYDTEDATAADRLSVLLDRLDLRKVNSVGLLDQPARLAGPAKTPRPAAAVFGVNEDWEAALEPVLTRMGMKMTWFQLGRDKDRSFVGNPNLLEIIGDIRNRLQAFSPELQLALAWDYQEPLPEQNGLPWVASQMSTDLQLTANELRSYLADAQRLGHTRWVTLNPLPANRYATLDRVRDLTERMLTVKEQQVEAAFVTTLLDADTGLFHPDGSAGEMFLPWRLLNQHLAAAQYLGSFTMPAGSTNHVLVQGQTGTLVVWNDRPATEQLYLGDNLSATDVWGRSVPLEQVVSSNGQVEHRLQVNEWPLIVNGVNVSVAKWRMNFALKNRSLPSLISQRTDLPIDIENSLAQTASGSVTLHAPSLLQSQVIPVPFQMNPGEQVSLKMAVPIRTDASAGNHSLRFDFQVTGERDYRFSVYDSLTLGAGDVEMRWELLDVSPQRLGLRVELFNHTEAPISFDCKLFPPNQPYRRFQISDIPPGNSVREITLPFAELQTDSMLWIRSEQLGSRRILNYRIPLQSSGMP